MAAGTVADLINVTSSSFSATPDFGGATYASDVDGFDLVWRQSELQLQMQSIEDDIRLIEQDANLSDTERMFQLQMAHNAWSAIATLRTQMLKSISDCLKSTARNV